MVLDVGQAAGIFAGGVFCFTHGLIQRRIAGLVLGVNGHIVVPRRAINGSHGQRHKEGVAGAGDILRDAGLHHQVQALFHIRSRGVTGSVRLGHGRAILDRSFQRVLGGGSVGGQDGGELVVQQIGSVIVFAVFALVGICGRYADGGQHRVSAVEAIQHTHLTLALHQFIVHGDVGHAEVCELYALNGILAQLVGNRTVMQAGGNVGLRVPRAIAAGRGDVVFIDGKGCFLAGVDDRLCERCGDEAQSHNNGHEQCQYAMDLFHLVVSFISIFLRKQTLAIRASAANRK